MSNVPSGPPPIEPMSDVAWARVERGLMQRLDAAPEAPLAPPSRRRWWWIAAPALAVAAAIVLAIGLRGPEPVATTEPSRVVAGEAPSTVSFGDAHLALEARSAIVMTQEAGAPSVLVERGVVGFTVAPRAERPAFVVRAGDVVVRVVGTKFEVARYEERVTVAVEHGIVDVVFRGATVRVGAQQRWSSESPDATETIALAPVVAPSAPRAPSSAPAPLATAPSASPAPSATAPSATAPSTTATAPSAVASAPPVVAPSARPGDKPAAPRTETAPRSSVTAPAPTAILPPTAAPGRSPAEDQREFERLGALEPKDPAAAIAGYLVISRGTSQWASNALFAAGRLAADRKDPRAKTFLQIYLRRFPSGSNVADAKTLLDRLQGASP